MSFQETIEWANNRGVGQFHVFDSRNYYHTTWRSYEIANAVAARHGGKVFNDSGDDVTATE